jgi:hypothetical protein
MAASRQLVKTETAHAQRTADTRKAAEVAQRHARWNVWSSRDGNTRVATRTGDQQDPDDGTWAATLIADTWADLELQLAAQAQHDAERTCEALT